MNARTPKQKSANWERAYHSKERVMFVRSLPCATCGAIPWEDAPSHNSHIYALGTSIKEDYTKIIPQCMYCHSRVTSFDRDELERLAARTEQAWQNQQEK